MFIIEFLKCTEITYMSKKTTPNTERFLKAKFQLFKKVVLMKVFQLFQVSKDTSPLAPKVLWDIRALQLWEVVLHDIAQCFHIFFFSPQQLLHDVLQLTARTTQREEELLYYLIA